MMKRLLVMAMAFLCIATINLHAQTTVSGVVTDAELGETLIGANVIIEGTSVGSSTDFDGSFSITSETPLPWNLEVSYTGFSAKTITIAAAQTGLSIALDPSALMGQEVVVSASRRKEKVQEAPASISVFNTRKLEASPNDNPVRNLISAPGVTIQQQSASRINIQLRGDGGLFGSASFPILDYRSLSGPGLGTFDALNSPLNNIDIDRIEVVRGPGSALYGPGVTAGVIHFISKSPIDKPGTTIELVGGELKTIGASLRHATKISDKFGFKVNVVAKRGNEFTLDINDPEDAARIDLLQTTIVAPAITNGIVDATIPGRVLLTESDLDPDGDGNPMQEDWKQFVATASLEFRPADDLSINVAGGMNSASSVFYNSQGEGLSQATEVWAQARMQKGGLFVQAFVLNNNGGTDKNPTFLYQTGNSTGISRQQLEAQVQYNFDLPNILNSSWTTGFDYRLSVADTKNQVYGRNEEDDDFAIYGGYLQGKFGLFDKLDLVLAGRVDRFNFIEETAFTPRAVFVYKASPKHTFRFGYNKAVAAPSQLQVNIDFPVSSPVRGAFDVWLLGNKNAQTFTNPEIVFNGLVPFPNLPVGTPGLPLGFVQGALQGETLDQIFGAVAEGLIAADPVRGPLLVPIIEGFLRNPANFAEGLTGELVGVNLFNGQPLGLLDAPKAELRKEDTWEFGYKGLIGEKFGLSVDVYNRKINGATLFTAISPGYTLRGSENVGAELGAAVEAKLIPFITETITPFVADEATRTALAATVADAYKQGYTAGGDGFVGAIGQLLDNNILATVPTDGLPNNGITNLGAGYRTFEEYDYVGVDVGLEYYANQELSFFANYSYISKNVFTPVIKGTDGGRETTSISSPENKFRLGLNYVGDNGFRGNLSFQHDDSFEAFLGQYSGQTDEKNLVDLGIGYKLKNGLSIDVSAQNLFNTEYRTFPGFPKIGRRTMAKLTYTFGDNK